ncbi:hypothetical protein B0T20DRAFT_49670 [Sordaria brevicollis]|uniref:Uncharacterized protein n=1 Tax=Sordaria brevicollis TaxID=83679 RepID=A0AAE0P9R2_SORBR|nr:hypothetical protein B0T20DRAFT_49670 [Sordaria brevicollis]
MICGYDSSSDSDNSSRSYLSEYEFRRPTYYNTPSQTRSYGNSSTKKRTWSETDDESDLPGVPNYSSSSSTRFSYNSDSDSIPETGSRSIKRRRRAGIRKPIVPVTTTIRHFPQTPAPRPMPTTPLKPQIYQPPTSRFTNHTLSADLEYLTLSDPSPSSHTDELEDILFGRPTCHVTHIPQRRPEFQHVYPAPKPTTGFRKPKVKTAKWLGAGAATSWSFNDL